MAIAPAMNQAMWAKAATQQNCSALRTRDVAILGPGEGLQACGETGQGRLLEVDAIVTATANLFTSGLLAGKHVVITAGPTREAIDPVRYITNHSSGKQGYALATAAIEAGARVTLVSGPTNLSPPDRVTFIPVVSAHDMFQAVKDAVPDADIFIGVAAVADYKPVSTSTQKIKKSGASSSITLELTETQDIIASVANSGERPFTVGFAAETENLIEFAKNKREKKNLDMLIANNVADQEVGFNSERNRTTVLWHDRILELPLMSKAAVSSRIIELVAESLGTQGQ